MATAGPQLCVPGAGEKKSDRGGGGEAQCGEEGAEHSQPPDRVPQHEAGADRGRRDGGGGGGGGNADGEGGGGAGGAAGYC